MENEGKRKTSEFFQKDIDKGEMRWYNNTRREKCAGVAQLAEQLICNQQVGGSNPSTSSILTSNFIIWGNSRAAKGGRL